MYSFSNLYPFTSIFINTSIYLYLYLHLSKFSPLSIYIYTSIYLYTIPLFINVYYYFLYLFISIHISIFVQNLYLHSINLYLFSIYNLHYILGTCTKYNSYFHLVCFKWYCFTPCTLYSVQCTVNCR